MCLLSLYKKRSLFVADLHPCSIFLRACCFSLLHWVLCGSCNIHFQLLPILSHIGFRSCVRNSKGTEAEAEQHIPQDRSRRNEQKQAHRLWKNPLRTRSLPRHHTGKRRVLYLSMAFTPNSLFPIHRSEENSPISAGTINTTLPSQTLMRAPFSSANSSPTLKKEKSLGKASKSSWSRWRKKLSLYVCGEKSFLWRQTGCVRSPHDGWLRLQSNCYLFARILRCFYIQLKVLLLPRRQYVLRTAQHAKSVWNTRLDLILSRIFFITNKFTAYIQNLPLNYSPGVLGLHSNADVVLNKRSLVELITNLMKLQPQPGLFGNLIIVFVQ